MDDRHRSAMLERLRVDLAAQARRKVRNEGEIEELVQEVIVRCVKRRPEDDGELLPYARVVLTNLIRRRLRAGELTVPNDDLDAREAADPRASRRLQTLTVPRFGRDELADEELAELLRALTRELPRDLRCVCEPRWFEGVPYRDIARRLGIDETTARVRCHKARRCLQCDPSVLAALGYATSRVLGKGRRATRTAAPAGSAARAARRSGSGDRVPTRDALPGRLGAGRSRSRCWACPRAGGRAVVRGAG